MGNIYINIQDATKLLPLIQITIALSLSTIEIKKIKRNTEGSSHICWCTS